MVSFLLCKLVPVDRHYQIYLSCHFQENLLYTENMLCCRGLNMVIHISKHNSHSCWMELFQMQGMWDCPCAIINQVSFNFKIGFPSVLWPCQWGELNPAALCLCLFLGWVSKHFCSILFQELLDTGNKFCPSAVVIFASFDLKMKNWHEWHKRVTVKSFSAQVRVLSLTFIQFPNLSGGFHDDSWLHSCLLL